MFKDFNKFINEGYLHSFEDSFISEFEYRNVSYTNKNEKYDDVDEINVKLEWKIQLEIQKDGIYSFNFSGVKAVIDARYVTGYDENEEAIHENKIYEVDNTGITFENPESFNQIIIKDVDIDFNNGETPSLIFNLLGKN